MSQCTICGVEMTKNNKFTEKKSYKNHSTGRDRQLWTSVTINGAIEYLTHSDPIKPLCIKCAIGLLEDTVHRLKGDVKW